MNTLQRNMIRATVTLACVSVAVVSTVAASSADDGVVAVSVSMIDATPLRDGNVVRASGVEVGSIESVTLGEDGNPLVRTLVGREILPLHEDATATLIDADLLGERFLSINPGTPSAPVLAEPYHIRVEQTKSVTDLQALVDVVDDPTGTGLAMMLTTLGEGIGNNPEETRDAIAALQPAMERTNELNEVLRSQNVLLNRLVETAQPVASAVANERGASLDRLVGSTTTLLEVTTQNRQQIQDSLDRLPATLQSAQKTLAELAGLAAPTTSTLKSLRPVTDDLSDISGELKRFANAADPALSALRPVLDVGNELLDELGPLAADLRPAGDDLREVASGYRALADGGLSTRLVDLMEFMKGWTLSTSDYDAYSHYFKAVTPYSPKTGAATVFGPVPGAPEDPARDFPTPQGGRTENPLGHAEGAPHEEYPAPNLIPESATGLSSDQEQSMMDQLLGGG